MTPFKLIDNPKNIDEKNIETLLKNGTEVTVQFSQKRYTGDMLARLNELCAKYDDQFVIRFYGHYPGSFDCKTLLKIPAVKSLWVDPGEAENIDVLTGLPHLSRLTLGISDLADTEILNAANFKTLHYLAVLEAKTKALNLDYLRQYTKLKSLKLSAHTKNIDAVGDIEGLEELVLNNIKKTPLVFVNRLKKLHKLAILLGGRDNINEIDNDAIKELDISFVRGFSDLGQISRFSQLEKLHIEDEAQLATIHFDQPLPHLGDIKIINCKTLTAITGLAGLTALHSLRVVQTAVDFNQFIQQPMPATLKQLGFFTLKSKADAVIKGALEQKGYICD